MQFRTLKLAALAAFFIVNSTSAAILYTNGASGGTAGAGYMNGVYAIANSLTVGAVTDVSAVEFTVWNTPGETPATVDWAFTTDPDAFPDGQTAVLTVDGIYPSSAGQDGTYAVEDVSFGVQGVQLAVGTWYLVLHNGITAQGGKLLWDENFGPSVAYQRTVGAVGSETFAVYGDGVPEPIVAPGIPEPGTWALMLVGVGVAGATVRRQRRRGAAAA